MLAAAAADLAGVGSALNAANAAAGTPTATVLAAGAMRCRGRLRRCSPGMRSGIRR
ncbi:PE domain-containing protein [Mycobacterium innocens]|uniref:PE domain-containing protein n=1 Tax=Mycobacterium innocens TaxID=2341083 RepID=UPI000A9FFCD0|nr:PE domain-containing protein [Mycobacterium innocens]